jgi:hypothetical protein
MATIDISDMQRIDINKYFDMLDWLETEVGQHVKKGNNYSICIFESNDYSIHRTFGIGWHMDYVIKDDMTHRVLTVYDEMKAFMVKLIFCGA